MYLFSNQSPLVHPRVYKLVPHNLCELFLLLVCNIPTNQPWLDIAVSLCQFCCRSLRTRSSNSCTDTKSGRPPRKLHMCSWPRSSQTCLEFCASSYRIFYKSQLVTTGSTTINNYSTFSISDSKALPSVEPRFNQPIECAHFEIEPIKTVKPLYHNISKMLKVIEKTKMMTLQTLG